jgi:hypothetical protein
MAITFPSSPTTGQTYTVGGSIYTYNGYAWVIYSQASQASQLRWRHTATGGETTLSGSDDNGNTLSYTIGQEMVYVNGVLLERTGDYTATSGTSVVLSNALVAGDIFECISYVNFNLTTAVNQTQFTATGDILVGNGASSETALHVGSNATVLTADSTQTLGVKWAAPVDTTKVPLSTVTAKGDLITATASSTPTNLTVGSNDQVLVADSTQTTGMAWKSYGAQVVAGKNKIINGNMDIWQRGTSFNDGGYNADRWQTYATQSGKISTTQTTSVPTGFNYATLITSNTAYTCSSSDYFMQTQRIEGYNIASFGFGTSSASNLVLSFWVKSSLTGTFGGAMHNNAFNRTYVFSYSITSANTWQKISIPFTADTTGTWVTTNAVGLEIGFSLGAGSSGLTSTGWQSGSYWGVTGQTNLVATSGATWAVTGVQLEAGSVATPFATATGNIASEIAACQRYYYRITTSNTGSYLAPQGIAINTTLIPFVVIFPTAMRATPNSDIPSTSYFSLDQYGVGTGGKTISSISYSNTSNFSTVVVVQGTGYTSGQAYGLELNSSSGYLGFSAEL